MSVVPIKVPVPVYPKTDPENPCPCSEFPMELAGKICYLFWLAQPGEQVKKGQIVAELECEKRTGEIPSPADGILHQQVDEGGIFEPGELLGYVEETT